MAFGCGLGGLAALVVMLWRALEAHARPADRCGTEPAVDDVALVGGLFQFRCRGDDHLGHFLLLVLAIFVFLPDHHVFAPC